MDLDTIALSAIQYRNLHHVEKWPQHIDVNVRLYLIQEDREVVQHNNTNFSELSTVIRSVRGLYYQKEK